MLTIDHIVLATTDLAAGTAELEARLGLPLSPGGQHAAMGTHNRLLSLGPEAYLELIAIDPQASAPDQPRWYALDQFSGPTRLTHWAARVPDLEAVLRKAPAGAGRPWDLARGALRWRMAIPETGQTPMDGLYPALLEWRTPHPAPQLPDHGLRLTELTLGCPDPLTLRATLPSPEGILRFAQTAQPRLQATLTGPGGTIEL